MCSITVSSDCLVRITLVDADFLTGNNKDQTIMIKQ